MSREGLVSEGAPDEPHIDLPSSGRRRRRAAMTRRLRIFLSSPGDLASAREIAAHTIEKLAQDYGRHFQTIEPYIWQHEAMLASKHFQDSIEPPSAFDIVVLILWSRL